MPTYRQGTGCPAWVQDFFDNGIPPGERNKAIFRIATWFRKRNFSIEEAKAAILPAGLKSRFSEADTFKPIESAYRSRARPPRAVAGPKTTRPASAPPRASQPVNLPNALPDGFKKLLETLFKPGEYVALSDAVGPPGKSHPDAGQTLPRERWLEMIAKKPIGEIYQAPDGGFFRINPMKPAGKTDADVTAFRHVLAEFDNDENGSIIPKSEQYAFVIGSGLPIAAVIDSGFRSLHFIVRINAPDLAEFCRRRDIVFQELARDGLDSGNSNPSRYSRLPDVERCLYDENGQPTAAGYQRLLAINLGASDWDNWESRNNALSFPEIIDGERIQTVKLSLPPEIICGILSRGEKGELAGGSKSYKTWALIHQAIAIASGLPWWDFQTSACNVIFLNLEIPQSFFEDRVRTVANALGIQIPKSFKVWHLRQCKLGEEDCWNRFLDALKTKCACISNPYLTSDPIYKLLGGRNENSAGDVQMLLAQLEDMIAAVDGANFFGHHFSKGNQSSKEAIDRAAGSGVFQRDPDTIFTMTPHENDSCFVVDSILRNHPPINPFVVRWNYPLFERDTSLDPTALKQPKKQPGKHSVKDLLYWLGNDHLKTTELRNLVLNETGMSRSRFFELWAEAKDQNLVVFDGITKTWEKNGAI
jgi:RecA-family ATPase